MSERKSERVRERAREGGEVGERECACAHAKKHTRGGKKKDSARAREKENE